MESHQVLRKAVAEVGAKRVAADMKVSPSLVYKWCQPPAADDGRVDPRECRRIRTVWQRLKQYGEAFVCACERGLFA